MSKQDTLAEQFSGTRSVDTRVQIPMQQLGHWLAHHLPGFDTNFTLEQFKGGQSNPTYLVKSAGRQWVMRSKPAPAAKLLPSAHAIEREYRVMHALADTPVPVPTMRVLCENEAVMGRAFYVMDHVDGTVYWDPRLPSLDAAARTQVFNQMGQVVAALHSVDVKAVGLEDFGASGDFYERQLSRWTRQYRASETQRIDAMEQLIEWLPVHQPPSAQVATSLVHGDLRLDNLLFDRHQPTALALLDWELATLGDPLADFAYNCLVWFAPPGQMRGLAGVDVKALGLPSVRSYVAQYVERTGRDPSMHWNFYMAYNLFRLAAIMQGVAKRALDGTASSAQAASQGALAAQLAQMAWQFAQSTT